ncbi:hypothetical protein DFH07DRAFT_1000667 [Mycena maculata]|uniref:Uncharacterized protein n=1 Tax=Mycena maculata TaxID=230809 RepID=A0AAD7HSZ7_9AGAR|nr:hypothetical protein DFH07DRAFT_1000667 [Mycena maculata]
MACSRPNSRLSPPRCSASFSVPSESIQHDTKDHAGHSAGADGPYLRFSDFGHPRRTHHLPPLHLSRKHGHGPFQQVCQIRTPAVDCRPTLSLSPYKFLDPSGLAISAERRRKRRQRKVSPNAIGPPPNPSSEIRNTVEMIGHKLNYLLQNEKDALLSRHRGYFKRMSFRSVSNEPPADTEWLVRWDEIIFSVGKQESIEEIEPLFARPKSHYYGPCRWARRQKSARALQVFVPIPKKLPVEGFMRWRKFTFTAVKRLE